MKKQNYFIFYFLLINIITTQNPENFEQLDSQGTKGYFIQSVNGNLYLISSSGNYRIFNSTYHELTNQPKNMGLSNLNKNFFIYEYIININTDETVFFIANKDINQNIINLFLIH